MPKTKKKEWTAIGARIKTHNRFERFRANLIGFQGLVKLTHDDVLNHLLDVGEIDLRKKEEHKQRQLEVPKK